MKFTSRETLQHCLCSMNNGEAKNDLDAHFKMPYLERFVHAAESLLDGPMEIVFLNRLEPAED